jgi:glycosyltransferase involved in cell wall biosynthesis
VELVSVVIPCFDAERWLAGAIESALALTEPPVEVIVVDDGSTDGSRALAESYGAPVRVLTGANQGPGAARNRGLEAAGGAWVQFLDADDLLLPRKVEACLAAVDGPDAIPFGQALSFGGPPRAAGLPVDRWLRGPPAPFLPGQPIVTALTYEIQTSQSLYPAERLRAVGGFRAELRWLEDIDLNLRLALAGGRFVPVPEPLVLLRDHRDPNRQRLKPGAALGRLHGEALMAEAIRSAGRIDSQVEEALGDRLAYAARQAWIAGHHAAAEEAFQAARALSPAPRPTNVPLYNALVGRFGLQRTERWLGLRSAS